MDLLEILKNYLKNVKDTLIIVFEIEINTKTFTIRLLDNKIEKTVKGTSKVLAKQSALFFYIQLLIRFFSFCFQTICLNRIFIKKL